MRRDRKYNSRWYFWVRIIFLYFWLLIIILIKYRGTNNWVTPYLFFGQKVAHPPEKNLKNIARQFFVRIGWNFFKNISDHVKKVFINFFFLNFNYPYKVITNIFIFQLRARCNNFFENNCFIRNRWRRPRIWKPFLKIHIWCGNKFLEKNWKTKSGHNFPWNLTKYWRN